MTSNLPLPDFLVIAPAKSGTNTLFHILSSHPKICLADNIKGTRFFTDFYDRGTDWYSRFFRHCPADRRIGEVDETYFFSPQVPQRLARHIPQCRLITCLRNPVQRAWSLYLEFKKFGFIQTDFSQALQTHYKPLVEDSFYDLHLTRYLEYFPRENILVLLFDELKDYPQQVANRIFAFLQVPPLIVPPLEREQTNPARPARFPLLNRLAFKSIWLLRRLNLHRSISRAKHLPLIRKLLFKAPYQEYPAMPLQHRQELSKIFGPHNQALQELWELDLTPWQEDTGHEQNGVQDANK